MSERNRKKARETMRELRREYRDETKRELERNRKFYKHGKGKHLVNLDSLLEADNGDDDEDDNCYSALFGDGGKGADDIRYFDERTPAALARAEAKAEAEDDERQRRLSQAMLLLILLGHGHLIPVLTLIAKNGSNAERSIKWLANGWT